MELEDYKGMVIIPGRNKKQKTEEVILHFKSQDTFSLIDNLEKTNFNK